MVCAYMTVRGFNPQLHMENTATLRTGMQEFWRILDFFSFHPESAHTLTWLLDDVGAVTPIYLLFSSVDSAAHAIILPSSEWTTHCQVLLAVPQQVFGCDLGHRFIDTR